jgi:hypothetical protein
MHVAQLFRSLRVPNAEHIHMFVVGYVAGVAIFKASDIYRQRREQQSSWPYETILSTRTGTVLLNSLPLLSLSFRKPKKKKKIEFTLYYVYNEVLSTAFNLLAPEFYI